MIASNQSEPSEVRKKNKKTTESTSEKSAARKRASTKQVSASAEKNPDTGKTPETEAPDRRMNVTELMDKLIHKFAAAIDEGGIKPTVGDFLRLVQAQKEMDEEQPREVRIEWVDPEEEESAN